MFIGHFGFALAAKKTAPQISLGTLFIAAQWLDLLWPTLLLFNIEQVSIKPGTDNPQPLEFIYYPWSHSLLMVILWSCIFGIGYWLYSKNKKGAIVIGICVLSHWVLDLIVHYPDLPLFPGDSPLLGFGLWQSPVLTGVIESAIFITGVVFYLQTTFSINATGKFVFWFIIALLVISHLASIFGPPPPDVKSITWAGQLQWLFVLLAYWADRNRRIIL